MTAAILITATIGFAGHPLIDARAPEFSLRDQYDKEISLGQLLSRIVVIIASDKKGSDQNTAWKNAILGKYRDKLILLGAADVRSVPFFMKSRVRKNFQNEPGSVLLDWKGALFTSYDLKPNVANVILIDRNGCVRYVASGPADAEALDRLSKEIDRLK
jgi:predicted transcriptional regulator